MELAGSVALAFLSGLLITAALIQRQRQKPAAMPIVTSMKAPVPNAGKGISMFKKIQVAPGQVIRLTHPETGELLKLFQAGEAIVEKDWNLVEGFLESHVPAAIVVTNIVPNVSVAPA